jgi:hypothetical protein
MFWSLAKRKTTCIAVATEVVFRDASGQKIKFWATNGHLEVTDDRIAAQSDHWQHSEVLHLSKTGGPRSHPGPVGTSERPHSRPT